MERKQKQEHLRWWVKGIERIQRLEAVKWQSEQNMVWIYTSDIKLSALFWYYAKMTFKKQNYQSSQFLITELTQVILHWFYIFIPWSTLKLIKSLRARLRNASSLPPHWSTPFFPSLVLTHLISLLKTKKSKMTKLSSNNITPKYILYKQPESLDSRQRDRKKTGWYGSLHSTLQFNQCFYTSRHTASAFTFSWLQIHVFKHFLSENTDP